MKSALSGSDLLGSASSVQKSAEKALGGKFETVVALDDFAYKSHFKVRRFFDLFFLSLLIVFVFFFNFFID